jgi:transcriptional antiterminator RfaH
MHIRWSRSLSNESLQVEAGYGWVVANTQPNRERIALDNLSRQEFHAYCPLIRKRITHARRTQEVLRPLFPGYVFVKIDSLARSWRPILSTVGVRTLVRFGETPSFVEEDFIAELKAREVDGAVMRPGRPYRIGQEVRVAGGAFDGTVATIIEMDERDRMIVLMELLKRPVKVTLTALQVAEA